ncbi:unnamed protein product [Prunus armeniaca]
MSLFLTVKPAPSLPLHSKITVLLLANCFVFSPFCPLIPSDLTMQLFLLERHLVQFQLAGSTASGVKMEELGWFFDVYIWRLRLFYRAICPYHQFWFPLFTDFLDFFFFRFEDQSPSKLISVYYSPSLSL